MFEKNDIFFKYLGGLVLIVGLLIFSGIISYRHTFTTTNDGTKKEIVNSRETSTSNYKFTGDKDQQIYLNVGITKVNITYSGSGDFTADLLNRDGSPLFNLEQKTGAFEDEQSIQIPESNTFILSVRCKGDWSFTRE